MTDAADWLRRAGHGRLADGADITWSIAEGRRGRRWREVRVEGEAVISSLLFETAPDRRFSHLELSTAAGLLTLHPEADETLHGNVVTAEGLRHVRGLAWPPDGVILLESSPITIAAAAHALWASLGPGLAGSVEGLVIGRDLGLARRSIEVRQLEAGRWAVHGSDPLAVSEAGMPLLPDGLDWPLEE